jgi:hypothetical protein
MDLKDRAVLITGGKRIGGVVATTVAARGADVALSYRGSRDEAEQAAAAVSAALGPSAIPVMRGANTIEFWWVKELPKRTDGSGDAWSSVPDGALVGAVRLAKAMTDIRGLPVKPGVYTLRFALQPQDGDHTGVSPFREFLLLAPAAEDLSPDPAGQKEAIKLSKKTTGRSHPSALSLDPPSATGEPGTVVTNDAGHKAVVFRVPRAGGGAPLTFGLILVGTIEHQM